MNFRQYKKKLFHKTMKHGGWRKYKKTMKEAGLWKVGKGIPHVFMKIKTLEGDMEVSEKDFIIKGVNGEFYPCKPDIFEKTYEKVLELGE